ncbi:MAG: hypothetical protein KDJ19_06915 [Hyphomicrobiaceae bacterium]|nr:hypothetical protein [Hyphomicrobiaceae bacterium]MCC0023683.1 hypothetical protein [Hyphomicrobiaceae bacterium]
MEHRTDIRPQTALTGQWKAASGKLVATRMERVEQFDLRDNRIYILSEAGHALWAGTVTELIEDHTSRTRFRDALRRASDVHSVSSPQDPTECMCLIYDLEAGEEQITLNAA